MQAQTHTHTRAEKHKQRLSLEARLAEAETGADGLFGGAVAGSSERFDCFQASRRNMTVCVRVCVAGGEQRFTYNSEHFISLTHRAMEEFAQKHNVLDACQRHEAEVQQVRSLQRK